MVGFASMDECQLSTGTKLGDPHLVDEIIGRLIRYENYLVEVKHDLGEVNNKLDQLLSSSTVDRTFGFHDPPAPIGLDQTRTQNGPLDSEGVDASRTHLILECNHPLINRRH